MAVTDQQKLDFLLKKIGYTKTKTGSVVGTGAISGTPKQPFAEAIPSPLIIANGALWNEADSIPATPPGADTTQVKVYLAATSGLRMTADATSSGQRAYIAYSTYGNTSSTRLTNWIDTQFGAGYIIKVYRGDPNSGGVNLSAAGSGANDGWFFDYSAGVLNFNDTSVPSGVTDTNIYIVGYRYIGQTGAPTSGISTFSYLDLTVERNLDVGVQGGISTFRNNIDLNADLDVDGHTNLDNVSIAGLTTSVGNITISNAHPRLIFNDTTNNPDYLIDVNAGHFLIYDSTNSANRFLINADGHIDLLGDVDITNDLDVDGHTNLDNVSVSGITTFSGIVDAVNTPASIRVAQDIQHKGDADTKISFPSADTITFDTAGTQRLNIASNGNISVTNDLDVDGHTNLDNISVAGVSTFTGDATFSGNVSIGGTLTYEDVVNVDAVGLITARSGIRVTGGVIEALAGENKIPSLYSAMSNLPSAGSYHGMFAHVHATGRGYFAHAGNWFELVNKEVNGVVGTGTERYNVGPIDAVDINVSSSSTTKSLNVVGVSTFGGALDINDNVVIDGNIDLNGDLDVDGHTNLDNVSVAGVSTFAGTVNTASIVATGIDLNGDLDVDGHTNLDNVSIAGVTTSQTINFATNTRANFASNNRLSIHSNGTNSYLDYGGSLNVRGSSGSAAALSFLSDSNVLVSNSLSINDDLDVDGHTNLDNVSVAGVTTFSSNTIFPDGVSAKFGTDLDGEVKHTGTNLQIQETTGNIQITNYANDRDVVISTDDGSGGTTNYFKADGSTGETLLYHYGNEKIKTTSTGVTVTGTVVATGADINGDLDVDGHTNLDNVDIVGVTTHQGAVLPSADVTYDLGSPVKQWRNLYADNIVSAPGNGFIGPDLTVRNFKATGISTFVGNARFNSTIAVHDGTTGSNGQYLKSVGTGVTWATFPTLRTRQTFTASAGQTSFTFTYTVNFIDVFVNGIKLTDSEFTATNGTSVVLAVGCFVGDIVELVSYNTVSTGAGGGGGSLNNIVEDTTPQLGGNLDLFNKSITGTGNINITGIISATTFKGPSGVTATFIGDGSGLTGITASGSGVIIKDSNNTVGTAGTINFGDNLSVSPASAGIVTITAGVTTSQFNVNKLHVAGITTFVGVTTFSDRVDFRGGNYNDVWFWAHPNLPNSHMVWRSWVAGGNGGLYLSNSNIYLGATNESSRTHIDPHGTGAAGHLRIEQYMDYGDNPLRIFSDFTNINGSPTSSHSSRDIADFNYNDGCALYHFGNKKLQTSGIGITVTGTIVATGADINGDIDVDGHTELDNVNIAGVVTATTFKGALQGTSGTFSSGVDITGDLDVDGHTDLDNVSIAGVVTATTFVGNGDFVELDVDGHTNLDNVSVAGVVTATTFKGALEATSASFSSNIDANGDLDVDGHTNLDNVSVAGVITATSFVGDGSSLTGISGGVTSDAQGNTVGGTNSGDSFSGTNAIRNTLYGFDTGTAITTADRTTAVGYHALKTVSTNNFNCAFGDSSLRETTGQRNNAFGNSSGIEVTSGSDNCFFGSESGAYCGSSARNTAVGNDSMYRVGLGGEGNYNTGVGYRSLYNVRSGDNNTAIGYQSGDELTGSNNIVIGANAAASSATVSNEITLGNGDVSHFRIPGIGVSFSEGGAVVSGVVTATSFVGDGSGLTGITASGSGVVIKHDGSTVGTAGTINFSTNLDVSAISGGAVTITASGGGGSGISTISGVVNIVNDLDVDGHTNLDNVSIAGVTTFSGTSNINTTGNEKLILSGSSNPYIQFQEGTTNKAYIQWSGGSGYLQLGNEEAGEVLRIQDGESGLVWRVGTSNRTVWTSGNDGASSGLDADLLDGQEGSYYSPNVGITTNLSGTFTASAGSPSTINTFGYGSGDILVEYTVFIKNGSDFQSQKLLAMRDGTTIHSTQFAVMYSSSLLVQLDATISSGNILLRATPETGVSGSTTYKVKREVM